MKKGKEISIESVPNYNVYSGTIDNKNSKTIYLNISSWGKPIEDLEQDYEKVIKGIRKRILQHTYNILLDTNFKRDNTIVDLDMRSSGINFNKKSFMSCEITLFQKIFNPVNSDISIKSIKDISNSIITNIFEPNEFFKFTKKK